jgi:hypothetical protein
MAKLYGSEVATIVSHKAIQVISIQNSQGDNHDMAIDLKIYYRGRV